MASNFSAWRIVLYFLVVSVFANASSGARKMNNIRWKELEGTKNLQQNPIDVRQWTYADHRGHNNNKGSREKHVAQGLHEDNHLQIKHSNDDNQKHAHNLSSTMDHMDPSLNVFFTINDLKVGKKMPIYFTNKDPSTSPHLLSREEANSLPFSSTELPYLLKFFSLSKNSPHAKAMEYTITQCELEPMKGETKLCAASLESMLDYARTTFGLDTHFKVLTTNIVTKPTAPLQNYTILEEPKEIFAHKMIGCHIMPYPYVVYYCHSQEGGNRLFEILLGGENGERVQAAGVCHMDTSQWDRDNVSFRVLKIKPGTSPVCHFFQADDMVWVPLPA